MKVICSDDEEKYFMRMINHKPLWKDRSKKAPDTVSNGACLVPLQSLSSYHLWVRRNMLLFPMSDEYVYVSGSNLILERFSTRKQVIMPLKSDCNVTSIYWQESSTNERLLLIGEKVFPNEYNKFSSGRVEIINLDCKLLPPKIILDHSIYASYDSYIYDCIMPHHSEICLTLLKKISMDEPQTKIFVWNYQSISLLDIEDFKLNLESIVRNPKRSTSFLLFDIFYVAIWEYNDAKKKMVQSVELYNKNCEEITDAEFIREKNFNGVLISFRSEWFEIIRLTEDTENNYKYIPEVYLRIDLFSIFDPNWVDMREINPEESNAKRDEVTIKDNFIPFDSLAFTPNFGLEKPTVSETKNYIKYVISRDKYILLFLENSPVVTILEFCDCEGQTKLKVSSIDKIEHAIKSKSSITINHKLTKMLLIVGEQTNVFYNLLATKRMEMALAIRSNVKYDTLRKAKEAMFALKEVSMSYYKYKINFVDNSPNFVFEEQLLQNTGIGFPVKKVLLSETPRMLMINTGQDELDLYIYKQIHTGPDKVVSLSKNYENDISIFIQSQTQFYKDQISFEFFLHYRLLDKPICLAFSPRSKQFFVSYKEGGYLYAIIGNEVREVFKVTLYCKACAFSQTGTYLAFATSEYDNEYNINIFNVSTNSFEWVIEKVPLPTKFMFYDRDSIFCALFNDNSTNFVAWRLNWNERLIKNTSSLNKEKGQSDSSVLIKISDFSGNINDFLYDHLFDHCLITSGDKRVRIYNGYKEEKHWEFPTDVEYHCVLFIKKIDTVFFGTSIGSIRSILWPIPNMAKDSSIEHPDFAEVFLHTGKVTSMEMSTDNKFLYSSGEDGSVFVSCIYAMSNEVPVTAKSFIYFAPVNFIPKTMHFTYNDIVIVTDALYQTKVDALKKKKAAIQSRISEFTSKKEKLIQSNASELDRKRTELTDILEDKVKLVKEKGNEKEKETKKMKEEREHTIKTIKDELTFLKHTFKRQKETKQIETTKLISCIKVAKEKFNTKIAELDSTRSVTNTKIAGCLESIHQIFIDKKAEIEKMITEKTNKFKEECEKNEEKYELDIRSKEKNFKALITDYDTRKKETDIEIMKKNKDNKNYKEKISEWENHLKELKVNNDELMETFLMNKLKLYQMNQLLSDNESKISAKERIVKEKRLVNDRLEQLRFVLEYQIKNLILEKTPIEEQIKNFESLHSDFYKRFNLLYAELLNISELIDNNQKCIGNYRDELSDTKKKLYQLKNLYKSIDIALNSILKSKLENKKTILEEIFNVYKTYLSNLNIGSKQNKVMSSEMKLQTKNIEKEIYHQKNNVLKELIDKRSERRKIKKEKEEMMKDIRLDNQLLIQECSNIRENLEDILKNINDIEKKFIELTNNNTFLNDDMDVVDIKGTIKHAKDNILLHDDDKTKIFRGMNNEERRHQSLPNEEDEDSINVKKVVSPEDLVKKQQVNINEMKHQTDEVEKMQKKLKELVGDVPMPKIGKERERAENLTENYVNKSKGKISISSQSSRNKNIANSRTVSIKTHQYYDSKKGLMK